MVDNRVTENAYQVSAGVAGRAYRWSGKHGTIRTGTAYAVVKDPAG